MAPRLFGGKKKCKFSKFVLSLNSQKRLGYKEIHTKVCPESLGAMLEYWYIERGLFRIEENTVTIVIVFICQLCYAISSSF